MMKGRGGQYYDPYLILWMTVIIGCTIIIQPSWGLQCYQHENHHQKTACGPGGCTGSSNNDGTELKDQKKNVTVETCEVTDSSVIQSCFVSWTQNGNSSEKLIQFSGCFKNDKGCVGRDECISRSNGKQGANGNPSNLAFYCCCDKDLCNYEFEAVPVPKAETTTPVPAPIKPPGRSTRSKIVLVLLIAIIPTFGICLLILCSLQRRFNRKQLSTSGSQLTDEERILVEKSDSSQSLPITLVEIKASGRFGKVWRGTLAGSSSYVAVKIISLREKTSWILEQEVYALPLMSQSEYVLRYICARTFEQPETDNLQLWLVTEYLDNGSLYDYLKGNMLTWNDLLKIATTMCNGLAFLHDEIDGGAKGHKPAVAHRDFKSKNVLLRPDLTACIADFGLAHIFYPTRPVGTTHGQVGTRRYMAPEVLDGAVCFTRDNFQRIDMYACALVLWELASRCNTHVTAAKEYRLPFEEYIGHHPSMDEMRELVATERKRPTIQNQWMSHPGLAVLAEAMRDAWDHDAEARISASCIVERLNGISENIV